MVRLICWILAILPFANVSAEMLRDPTQPLNHVAVENSSTVSDGGLKLGAIFLGHRPYAVINGKAIHEGEKYDSYLVKKISSGSVELEGAGETLLLKMHNNNLIIK